MCKKLIVVVLIALIAVATLSVTGQEEPLPVVRAKPGELTLGTQPTVFLADDPGLTFEAPTLAGAARANDYLTFDAVYTAANQRGERVAEFAPLHALWSWSMSDPIGAFYGQDLHDRLAAAYPGFARYIEDYVIVDSRGNVFYPTSETRAFLLDRAVQGFAPKVLIAQGKAESEPVTRVPLRPASARSHVKPATRTTRAAAPPVAAAAPVAAPGVEATPIVATKPEPVVVSPPITEPAIIVKAQEPAVALAPIPTPIPAQAQPVSTRNGLENRGILLLVIGLLGVGLLAVILRTPKQAPTVILPTPVEPFRKTPVPGSVKTEDQAKPRATGSHG